MDEVDLLISYINNGGTIKELEEMGVDL